MHDDDDEIRRQNYERMFGTTVEREAEEREMEERAAKLKTAEVLEWCRQRAEAREAETTKPNLVSSVVTKSMSPVRDIGPTDELGRPLADPRYRLDAGVTKSYGAPAAAAPVDADHWDKWRKFIIATVRKKFVSDEMLGKVLQQVGKIANERDEEIYQATRNAREEIAQLRVEIAELRGAAAVQRSQPTTSVTDDRRKAAALVKARAEIERLRAAMNCDGTARDLDLGRVRSGFDGWPH